MQGLDELRQVGEVAVAEPEVRHANPSLVVLDLLDLMKCALGDVLRPRTATDEWVLDVTLLGAWSLG